MTADEQPTPLDAPLAPEEAAECARVTDLNLDELERLANEATWGPWAVYATDPRYPVYVHIHGEEFYHVAVMDSQGHQQGILDAEFIAASRTALPALIAALRAAERERDALREALLALVDNASGYDKSITRAVALFAKLVGETDPDRHANMIRTAERVLLVEERARAALAAGSPCGRNAI